MNLLPQFQRMSPAQQIPIPFSLTALVCMGLLFILAGCATEVGHHTFLGDPYPPKSTDAPIDVYLEEPPSRPFKRVAILQAHCESQGWMEPNLENDALPMLKKQARAAGCDAIIEIKERKSENWSLETEIKDYTAVGIVYE